MLMRRILLPALLGIGALALAGCSAPAAGGGSDDGLSIVASTSQVADFTRQIAGDEQDVYQMLPNGAGAHSYDPSASDLAALAGADVLVINGVGLEEWLDDAIAASGFDGVVIDASEDAHVHEGDGHSHDHEGEDHAEDEHEHAEDEAEHDEADHDHAEDEADDHGEDEHGDEEHEHSHAEGDPHIWTSVDNAQHMVEHIAHELGELDADNAESYEANAAAYLEQLSALDEWITASLEQVPAAERLIVTNHDALGYFIEDYGITFVGAVIPSFDDNAEASAAQIEELVAAIQASGAKAVFSESSLSANAAETIAREAGVTVYAGDDSLYVDSLGAAGSGFDTYLTATIHNVRQIVDSWGAEALPLPAELTE